MNSDEQIKQLQAKLNEFTGDFLEGVGPISEDGITGPVTEARVKLVKLFLGYSNPSRVSNERLLDAVAHVSALAGAVKRDLGLRAGNPGSPPTARAINSAVSRSSEREAMPTNTKLRAAARLALASATRPPKDHHGRRPARLSKAARRGLFGSLVAVIVAATGSSALFAAPASAAPYTVTLTAAGYNPLRPSTLTVPISHQLTLTATANAGVGQRISSIRYIALYDTSSPAPLNVCYWGSVCSVSVTGAYGPATYVAYVGDTSGTQTTVLATSNPLQVYWTLG
jgi:hypothetical protein